MEDLNSPELKDNAGNVTGGFGPIEYVCFLVLWIPYAFLVGKLRFVTDDAFITMRYARNFANGNGLRYNLGDHVPVEGYSNFLWVVTDAVFEYTGLEVTFWPLVVSFACGSILLFLVFRTLVKRLELPLPVCCIAVSMLCFSPSFAMWSTGGLETMPFALLLYITFDRLILRKEGPAVFVAAFAGIATALMRIDGIWWALSIGLLGILSGYLSTPKNFKPYFKFFIILTAGCAVYYMWRFSYYGTFFSNTVYAKGSMNAFTLGRGLDYVISNFLTFPPMFLIIPGTVASFGKNKRSIMLPVCAMSWGYVCFAVLTGGDFMAMGRLPAPGLAFNALLAGWLISSVYDKSDSLKYSVAGVVGFLIVAGLLPAWDVHIVPESARSRFNFRHNMPRYRSEYNQWILQKDNARRWVLIGKELKQYTRPEDSVTAVAIGAVGYYSERYIYDRCGLVNREVAAIEIDNGVKRSPGHDKCVGWDYFLDKKPTVIHAAILPESRLYAAFMKWRRSKAAREYVMDFKPVDDYEINGGSGYLVIVRRMENGADPNVEWNKVMSRIKSQNIIMPKKYRTRSR